MDDFKAYAFQDGTDYRLVVSLPLNTTINSKNRVSIVIGTNTLFNLPIVTRDSDLFLEGGRVGDITLTEAQFNAIVPNATITVTGRSYYIDTQVELYNTRFFPRISSTTYYSYVVIDGDDYNLYFSAASSIDGDTENISIRFETDTNTFVNFNGINFEFINSNTEGLDDYFTQDSNVIKTTLTRTQWLSIASLFETEPEVGINFLTDNTTLQVFLFATVPNNATQLPTEGIDIVVGDNIYYFENNGTVDAPIIQDTLHFAGIVTSVTDNDIFYSTEPTSDTPSSNDFFLFGKNPTLETSGVIGFFSEIKFTSDDTARAELFSINSEVFQSSK